MSLGEVIGIAFAGMAAGTINTVVGSGTLITFPVLLAFGYAPVTANVSNTIGLVPGSVSGAIGYRRELAGQWGRVLRFGTMSVLGGITGAVLLLVLPASAFKDVVPAFIAVALVLTVLQPRLNRRLALRTGTGGRVGVLVLLAVYITGVYGGYFGAGQGILLLAILGVALPQSLHHSSRPSPTSGTSAASTPSRCRSTTGWRGSTTSTTRATPPASWTAPPSP